jgi:hypothetical protein
MHRLLLIAVLVCSCGDTDNPFGDAGITKPDSGEADTGVEDSGEVDTGTEEMDAGNNTGCAPAPARMVVLGDSIMACVGAGGKQADTCGVKALHTQLTAMFPDLTYENNSVGGAVTADVAEQQINTVQGGPGHVLLLIYIGGNDLAQYIFVSDQEAQAGYDNDIPVLLLHWQSIFTYFADETRFPDGVTLIMNTQYNPFDDCTAPPYNLSQLKTMLLHDFNMELTSLAGANPHTFIADQFTTFLGHGHHNTVTTCPHYMAGFDNWMADLIHANELGHANFVVEWTKITDQIYVDCQ